MNYYTHKTWRVIGILKYREEYLGMTSTADGNAATNLWWNAVGVLIPGNREWWRIPDALEFA